MTTYLTLPQFIEALAAHENIEKVIAIETHRYEAREGFDTGHHIGVKTTVIGDRAIIGDSIAIEDAITFTFGDDRKVIAAHFGPFTPWWLAEAIISVRDSDG